MNRYESVRGALAAACLCSVSVGAATAADLTVAAPGKPVLSYPYITGTLDLELDNDWTFHSSDPDEQFNNFYTKDTLAVKFALTPIFSVNTGFTLEQIKDPSPPANCSMCGIGLYMDTLEAEADVGNWTFLAGKHEPSFGFAWDEAPGVFGTNYAEDYELAEVIGFGAAYTFKTGFGEHTLTVNTFFADTTVLSQSLFADRGRRSLYDGGAGNTENFDNFAVTLFGEKMPGLSDFKYNIGYRHLAAGRGDYGAENGYIAGVEKDFGLGNGFMLGALGEVAYFENWGGTNDDALYSTTGVKLTHGPWHGELTGEIRDFRIAGTDHLVQLSGGYTFENGIDVAIGYGYEQVAGVDNQMIGLRLTKSIDFSTR